MPWADQQMSMGQNIPMWNPPYNSMPIQRFPSDMELAQNAQTQRLSMILPTLQGLFGSSGGGGSSGSLNGFTTGFGQSAGGNTYNSGIQAGPVLSQPQVASQMHGMQQSMMRPNAFHIGSPAQQAALGQNFQSAMNGEAQRGMLDYGRAASQANAGQQLASESARAQAGLRGGGLLNQLASQRSQANAPGRSFLMNTLLGQA